MRVVALGTAAALCCAGARAAQSKEPGKSAKLRAVFDAQSGLAPGWTDLGWSPREVAAGAPASIDFSDQGGWIVANFGLDGAFTALTFRVRAPPAFGDFLDVRLDASRAGRFQRVRVKGVQSRDGQGWSEVRVPFSELNPQGAPFDRIVFQAAREVGHDRVLVDQIALVEGSVPQGPVKAVQMAIDCSGAPVAISQLIYGVAHGDATWWETGATTRRWGGNPNTRYNWEIGNAWNTGGDWFFHNTNFGDTGKAGPGWQSFLKDNRAHGARSAITVPMIGWVAKDTTSYSFPVSVFGPQQGVDPQNADAGNGVARDGTLLKPSSPSRTSVPAPPSFVGRWAAAIRAWVNAQGGSVDQYILDNEPTLWNATHRDVHPQPIGYDELLERTIQYASAVREADPAVPIAGFVAWGWTGYFFSARDAEPSYQLHLDRIAHGDEPLLPWWLRNVRQHETRTGVRLIDYVDVHFYPQGQNIGIGSAGATDPDTSARRIRATRSLWDPTYVDESWINEPMRLIPRLREWVDQNARGVGTSIGEYNFGAEGHMSGGLALAEALGRFGQTGLASAFYWTAPPKGSPAFWAFRAYRNFDGKGGHFLDLSLPVRSDDKLTSVFASRDASGKRLVAVLLQLDPSKPAAAVLDVASCGTVRSRRVYSYTGDAAGFTSATGLAPNADRGSLRERLPPYSITVLDLQIDPKKGRR